MRAFPSNPTNGETTIVNNILYVYSSINNSWNKVSGAITARVGLKTTDITVAGAAVLNAISANGTLGIAGQVLTSTGSDTFWAIPKDPNIEPIRDAVNEASTLDVTTIFKSLLQS
jgi:hypothetical protein